MKQVTVRQLELLINFMGSHKDLALGRVRSKEGRVLSAKLWAEIANTLNCESMDSSYRSPRDWNKFYNDYKCRLRNKVRRIAQSQRKTGGGPADVPPLTELEERLCAIIGPDKFTTLDTQHNPLNKSEAVFFEPPSQPPSPGPQPSPPEYDGCGLATITPQPPSPIPIIIENYEFEDIVIETSAETDNVNQQPSTSCRRKPSTAREHKESEVERTKNALLEMNRAQVEAQNQRNIIENKKVEAINNLANAIRALGSIYIKNEGKARKRARVASSSEDD